MEIFPPSIYKILTVKDCLIAIFIMAVIIAIEGGIIYGLSIRVGSLKNLFRLTASITNNHGYNSTNKKNHATNFINKKCCFKQKGQPEVMRIIKH